MGLRTNYICLSIDTISSNKWFKYKFKNGKNMENLFSDDIEIIKKILISGDDISNLINNQNDKGITPLNNAITMNRNDIFDLLLEYGANVNMPNRHGTSPIMNACKQNIFRMVNILFTSNAELSIPDDNGYINYLLHVNYLDDKNLDDTYNIICLLSMSDSDYDKDKDKWAIINNMDIFKHPNISKHVYTNMKNEEHKCMFLCNLIRNFYVESVESILPHVNDINHCYEFGQSYLTVLENSYFNDINQNIDRYNYNYYYVNNNGDEYNKIKTLLEKSGCTG